MRRLLDPRPGETLVLAAHHAAFDLGWLRAEVERVGEPPLPDLPVLDTADRSSAWPACRCARPEPRRRCSRRSTSRNERPHAALGRRTAAAEAAIALLERADGLGHRDLDALLADDRRATSASIRRAARRPARHQADAVVVRPMPPGHVATHERDLGTAPTADELAAFRGGPVIECAALRCEDLPARQAPDDLALGVLLGALDASASVLDVAGHGDASSAPSRRCSGDCRARWRRCAGTSRTSCGSPGPATGAAWRSRSMPGSRRGSTRSVAARSERPMPRLPARRARARWTPGAPRSSPPRSSPRRPRSIAFWNTTASGVVTAKGAGRGYVSMRNIAPGLADVGLRVCLEFHRANGDRAPRHCSPSRSGGRPGARTRP